MILIVPMGDVKIGYLEKAKVYVKEAYREDVKLTKKISLNKNCLEKKRKQYKASCLIKNSKDFKEGKIAYVCDVDLYEADYSFLFGLAENIIGRRCIVSILRLKETFYGKSEDENLLSVRIAKEIIHEVGHLKGLRHCPDEKCIMHISKSIYDTDFKDLKLCKECENKLNINQENSNNIKSEEIRHFNFISFLKNYFKR